MYAGLVVLRAAASSGYALTNNLASSFHRTTKGYIAAGGYGGRRGGRDCAWFLTILNEISLTMNVWRFLGIPNGSRGAIYATICESSVSEPGSVEQG